MTTLKIGSVGAEVRELQRKLKAKGYNIVADGWFGEITRLAVVDFQQKNNLPAVGEAGPRTQLALLGANSPRTLTHADLVAAAALLSLPLAVVATVAQVESNGHGFGANARPVILFERHVFYKQLIANGKTEDEVNALAERMPNIVNTARGGYSGGASEYARFAVAAQIDETSAIEACSWGMFQIMGYHWGRLGYTDAQEFRLQMQKSEGEQLQAFCKFILTDTALLKALQSRKWAYFARLYNGPVYKENLYDTKLARAYEQLSATYKTAELQPEEESTNA